VDNYENIPPLLKEIVVANYDDIKYLNEKILEMDMRINELCKINPLCGMLMEIPGIGPITAYSILSVIGDALQFSPNP
jgi:transposase